jgi:predicted nuclease with TOPRIM domain
MAVSESARRRLFGLLRERLGVETSELLFDELPGAGWDELATKREMNERFDRVETRFDRMDERFERMDERFERMDERFQRMEQRLDALAGRFVTAVVSLAGIVVAAVVALAIAR